MTWSASALCPCRHQSAMPDVRLRVVRIPTFQQSFVIGAGMGASFAIGVNCTNAEHGLWLGLWLMSAALVTVGGLVHWLGRSE